MNQPRFCKNCGHPLGAGERHCPMCGTAIELQAPQMPQMPPLPGNRDNGRKNNNLMVAVIILLAVLVAGVVVCVVLLAKDEVKPEDTEIVAAPEIDTAAMDVTAPVPAAPAIEEAKPVEASKPMREKSDYQYVVRGNIGKYSIIMELNMGSSITGRYRYKRKNGLGGWLSLSGYTSGKSFGMSEHTSNGDNTGNFDGSYSISGDKLTMTGTMWNAKGESFPFSVSGYAAE